MNPIKTKGQTALEYLLIIVVAIVIVVAVLVFLTMTQTATEDTITGKLCSLNSLEYECRDAEERGEPCYWDEGICKAKAGAATGCNADGICDEGETAAACPDDNCPE